MPITAATFLVGSLALAGIAPFSGFFSKDEILASLHGRGWPNSHGEHHDAVPAGHASLSSGESRTSSLPLPLGEGRGEGAPAPSIHLASHSPSAPGTTSAWLDRLDAPATFRVLFWMSLFTAGLTAFYTFRAVFMTFTGPTRVPEEAGHHAHESPPVMAVPLMILAVPSAIAGWWLFSTQWLAHFLSATPSFSAPAIAATATPHAFHMDLAIQGTLAAAIGIVIAAIGHLGRRSDGPQMERFLGPLQTFFANRCYIDQLYTGLIVRPLEGLALLAAFFDRTVIDGLVNGFARVPVALGGVVRRLQGGLLQRYALAGVMGVLAIVLVLAWQLRG
jgi:NADH-quinone oxidoreductase subunit L